MRIKAAFHALRAKMKAKMPRTCLTAGGWARLRSNRGFPCAAWGRSRCRGRGGVRASAPGKWRRGEGRPGVRVQRKKV